MNFHFTSSKWVALFILLNIVFHLMLLDSTNYMDESNFAVIGKWINEGSVFYRDMWNERGPLMYYFTAAFFTVVPNTIASVRILALFLSCIQIVLLYFIARRYLGQRWAPLAPLYYLIQHIFFLGTIYRSEQLDGVLILIGILLIGSQSITRGRNVALTGLIFGLLIMEKQTGLVAFVLVLTCLLYLAKQTRNMRSTLFSYLGGALPPWLLLFIYYAAIGELPTLTEAIITPITPYYILHYTSAPAASVLMLCLPSIIVALIFLAWSRKDGEPWTALFTIWLTFSILMAAPSFFLYQMLIPLLPVSFAFAGVTKKLFQSIQVKIATPILVAYLLFICGIVAVNRHHVWSYLQTDRMDDITQIAEIIQRQTTQEEPIWVFPHESTLYLLSNRRAASRYQFLLPWLATPERIETVLQDLEANRPPFIVYTHLFWDTSPGQQPKDYAGPIIRYVAEHYSVDTVSPMRLVLLRRIGSDDTQSPERFREVQQLLSSRRLTP